MAASRERDLFRDQKLFTARARCRCTAATAVDTFSSETCHPHSTHAQIKKLSALTTCELASQSQRKPRTYGPGGSVAGTRTSSSTPGLNNDAFCNSLVTLNQNMGDAAEKQVYKSRKFISLYRWRMHAAPQGGSKDQPGCAGLRGGLSQR